jgi:ketosteroid isomerase-like protein
MSHSLEQLIREAYAAFARGDVDGYLRSCTGDFTFNVPGQGGLSGTWQGQQGVHELARKAMDLTAGTFQEEVEDVLANDQHAVVLARHRFTRNGSPRDYRTAHVYDIRDGQLARCFEQPRDSKEFHAAWGSSQS